MKKISLAIFITVSLLTLSNISVVKAAESLPPSSGDFSSWISETAPNFSGKTVGDIITAVLPYIYGLAGFLMLLYLVYGGYQVLISQGDPKQMAAGKEKITWAIVGFLIMFSAYWITQLAGRILNIRQIREIFG